MPVQTVRPSKKKQGSMALFWVVMAAAAVLLVVYGIRIKRGLPQGLPGLGGQAGGMIAPDARREMVDFKLKTPEGSGTISLADLRGKVTVLHLWATWCGPCKMEFPEFAEYVSGRPSKDDIEVLAVSLDQAPEVVIVFSQGMKNPPPIYMDPEGELAGRLGTRGIPETLLIDRKGRIAFRAAGGQNWGSGGIPALVQRLRAEK